MRRKDPLLRAAMAIYRLISTEPSRPDGRIRAVLDPVARHSKTLARYLRLAHKAASHGWDTTAEQMTNRATAAFRQLQNEINHTLVLANQAPQQIKVALGDLHQDLLQLHREFDQVQVDLKQHQISIETEAIRLEGVYLGPFRTVLHIDRMALSPDVHAFDIVALDPHPASANEDVTHPHVQNERLCAGDATSPIGQALRGGRICDAFLAVHAVLQNYNPDSPYVRLDAWNGTPCSDCGACVDTSELSYCEDCEQDFCAECFGHCDICERSRCQGCLELDRVSHRSCCKNCRHTCGRCGRLTDGDSIDPDSGYCPVCHEQFLQEQEVEETV